MTHTELLDASTSYSLGSDDFMMAFTLEKFEGGILQIDPRYVKFIVRAWESVNFERKEVFYPLHECSESEMSLFWQAEND